VNAPIYTVELQAWDPASGGLVQLRYATQGFVTSPGDTPPNVFFDERLVQPAVLARHLFSEGTTSGRAKVGYGDLVLLNGDGALDALLTYGFDGRPLTIRRGVRGAAFPAGFSVVAELTSEQVEANLDAVVVKIRDRQRELEIPLQPLTYAGDNVAPDGLEGTAEDLMGKPKPRCFGKVYNVPAVLVNAAKLIYQVSAGPVLAIPACYDRGVPLEPGGTWHSQNSTFGSDDIYVVTWGNDLYVIAGQAGEMATSPDGITWTARTSGFSGDDIYALAYGEGLYVAGGSAGKLFTSPDAITWTARTSQFGAETILALTYSPELEIFVAVGTSATISTSPDGITWTARTSPAVGGAGGHEAVTWGAGLVVAVGSAGSIISSPDGITWTARLTGPPSAILVWRAVAFGNGTFVAAGILTDGTQRVALSLEGITWSILEVPALTASSITGMTYAGSHFIAVGAVALIASSPDGREWTVYESTLAGSLQTTAVVYNPDDNVTVIVGAEGLVLRSAVSAYADLAELEDDRFAPRAGEFIPFPGGGYFRLGAPPAGLVTADVTAGDTAADRTTAQIFSQILGDPLGAPLVEVNRDDLAALDIANDAVLGLWTGLEELTVAEALDLVAGSVGAWWGVDRTGVFRIQQFTAPSGSPVAAFTANDLKQPLERRAVADASRGLPSWRTIVRYARNYAVQTQDGLAAGVADDHRVFVGQEWREGTAEDAAVQLAHPLAPVTIEDSLLAEEADADAEAVRRQTLRGVLRQRFVAVVPLDAETELVDLGQVVTLTHARYGLGAGPSLRVLGVDPDVRARHVTLHLWR
jgi:hypothetical protein